MYTITIKGEAKTRYPNLEELDGISCQDKFSEYFDRDALYGNAVTGGYLKFVFENGKLFAVTTYDSTRELTAQELSELEDYTAGQWSDGIGEGFEQEPCYVATVPFNKYDPKYGDYENQADADADLDVFVSPWFYGQKTESTQLKK
jgi:hypothetical protein